MDTPTILSTLLASQQQSASNPQRIAATQLFEQLKTGEVHASASVATELLKLAQPPELQVLGYTLLQHLVGNRWEDFSAEEHSQLGTLAYNMLQQGASSWAIRSKASLLLALVIKRTGALLWEAALPQLLQAAASQGPAMQEQVCMVLRYVADEVTLFADDLGGDAKRLLLASLTSSLSEVLPFLERMLEHNFTAAGAAVQAGNREAAQQHVLVIQAALQAANTYSGWVPVGRLKDAGLIAACGFMLNTTEFRDAACDVIRQVAARRQADETPEVFKAVMEQVADALIAAAAAVLSPGAQGELGYEGQHDEFGQTLCETMATLGASHLSAVGGPDKKLAFLQHMLSFAQHPYLLLADKALPLWTKLLQDAAQSATHAAAASSQGSSSPRQHSSALPADCVAALMDVAADQLQKRGAHVPTEDDDFPPYFDTFADYKDFMVMYRSRLSSIVRYAAVVLPEQALQSAGRRLDAAVTACAPGSVVKVEEQRGLLEAAVHFTESTFKAVWDNNILEQPTKLQAVVAAMEPMLQRVLGLQVRDSLLMHHQARGLEAFQKIFAVRRDLLAPSVGRVFDLLVNNVPLDGPGQAPPPSKPPPGWRDAMHARQFTAMVLLAWTKACPEAFLPHLEAMATQVGDLWQAGRIRAGEKNAVQEAIVGAARAGPEQLQVSVLEWTLADVRTEWASPAWQEHLASPEAFIQQYTHASPDGAGGWQVDGQAARWALYHSVHLVERCIRSVRPSPTATSHPLTPHAEWALPNMLRIVACLHALHTPAGRAALAAAAPALDMSPQERALYLKRVPAGKPSAKPAESPSGEPADDGYASVGGTSAASLRAWLRHMREFTYQSVGLLPTHCPPAMDSLAIQTAYAQSAFAYIESLDHQHVRIILRHMIIPHVKNCADRHLRPWLLPALAIVVPHLHGRLTNAWGRLQAPAGYISVEDSESANDEIIQERMLRELTQEYASLLKELSTRTVGSPGGGGAAAATAATAAGGPAAAAAASAPGAPGAAGGKSALEWLLEADPAVGFGAVQTAVGGMCWRDESAYRFAALARTLVGMAPRDERLYAYVGGEVLRAAITSLGTETMATHQADVLQLIRDILVQQISSPNSAAHAVLASLPKMTPDALDRFRQSLSSVGSEKAQRDMTKKMLVAACGQGSLAALADWKPPAVTPLSETMLRGPARAARDPAEHQAGESFSAAAVSSLFDR